MDTKLPRRSILALICTATIQAQPAKLTGSWSATVKGQTLSGTWTAQPHEETDAAYGAWTLVDRSGRRLASGSWTARKAKETWEGRWSSQVSGGGAYAGTWTAQSDTSGSLPLIDLFQSAVEEAITGTWQADRGQSGAWSIRTAQP